MKVNIAQLAQKLLGLEKPFIMLMIGPPASGKSTVLRLLEGIGFKFHVASTDDILEREARVNGLTYAEGFKKLNLKEMRREMIDSMNAACIRGENIINDQTNMGSKKRSGMLAQAPKEYVRIGLSLNATNEELAKRLALREAETGKHVPMSVVVEMLKSYSPPSKAEGFDHLWELS